MNSESNFIKEYSDVEEAIISEEFNRVKSMFSNFIFYLFFWLVVCWLM